jgi:membrane-bound serine protease (ClpP class)
VFTSVLSDPGLVYFVLVFGLWAAVMAVYVPGTGALEIAALILVGGALVLFTNLPVNWLGVLLVIVGLLSFHLTPLAYPRAGRIAEVGLLVQALGAFLLFNTMPVAWWLILLTVGVAWVYHRYALMPLLKRMRQQSAVIDDNEQLVGAAGRVVKASQPVGKVHIGSVNVRGEHWTASSEHPLEVGDEVIVQDREGLQLLVEGVKHKHQTPEQSHLEERE